MASGNSSELVIKNSIVAVASQRDVNIKGNVNVYVSNNFEEFDLPGFVRTFQGRESDIEALDSLFFKQNQKKVVICGLPGYGKTELAKKFGSECLNNKNIESVFWIKSETKEDLQKAFPDLKRIYRTCKEQKCLFILDNGICRQDTIDYEPPDNDNYFLLVTSQEKDWDDDFVPVKLEPVAPEDALKIYKSVLGDKYNEEYYDLYIDLANTVGNVPLGLQITAGLVRKYIRSLHHNFILADYIATVKKTQNEIINETIPRCLATSYKKSLYGAIKVSLDKIKKEEDKDLADLALNALFICSYFSPDMIIFSHLADILNINAESRFKLILALSLVENLSFVNQQWNITHLKIHRLTQEILRFHLRSCESEKQTNYYDMCLKFVFYDLSLSMDFRNCHAEFIAGQADDNLLTTYQLYEKLHIEKETLSNQNNTEEIITQLLYGFLGRLVRYKSINCLKKIFTNAEAHKYICEFGLILEAVNHNQPEVLNFLLQYVDINCTDENKNTFLHIIALDQIKICPSMEHINIFIKNNANLNTKNINGNTPLFEFAKQYRYKNIKWVDYLNTLKFQTTETNNHGETLLHLAVMGWNDDLTDLLIDTYKMDVNYQDNRGRTALHVVVYNYWFIYEKYFIPIVKQLLKYGASLSIKDENGTTPATGLLQIAIKEKHFKLRELLLQYGVNVNYIHNNRRRTIIPATAYKSELLHRRATL